MRRKNNAALQKKELTLTLQCAKYAHRVALHNKQTF